MKKSGLALLLVIILFSCGDNHIPDVSGIKVPLEVKRFEQDFFMLDTNNIMASLDQLGSKYPQFLGDYVYNILELPQLNDSSYQAQALIKKFIADYKPIKDSADKIFKNFDQTADEIRQGLKFVKHYFPNYNLPTELITFIGPLEGYSEVITRNALAVGLQLHLGKDFSYYTSQQGQSLYPAYISRRFTRESIVVNSMKNIIDDISPQAKPGRPLVEQMVEAGKRLYVLDKILPRSPDTLKTGFTKDQLDWCHENEGRVWNFFVTNSLVYSIEPALVNGYMNDAPQTPEFGSNSPGAIGTYVGWQIVKKYMDRKSGRTLDQLLRTDPKTIFEESKYKPN